MDPNALFIMQMDLQNQTDTSVGQCYCSRSSSSCWATDFLFKVLEVILLPISVIGIIANFISIFILHFEYSNNNNRVCLLFQSVCAGNILVIVSGCLTDLTPLVYCHINFPGFENYLVNRLFFVIQVLPEIAHTFMLYLIILVTFTRLNAIREPRSGRERTFFFKNSLGIVLLEIILFLIAIFLNIPIVLEQKLILLPSDSNNSVLLSDDSPKFYTVEILSFVESKFYVYYKIFQLLLNRLLPIFSILVINLALIYFIKHNLAPRTNASNYPGPRSNEKIVVKILVIYVALFLISEIPATLVHLSEIVFQLYPN